MNDTERALWCENDEGLYLWRLSERMSLTAFIKEHKAEIDEAITKALK